MDIAGRITAARRSAPPLAQRDLAILTGLSRSTLHNIEAGTREAKINELISIAAALQVPLAELTGNSGAGRLICAAPMTNARAMREMRGELAYYFDVEDYLDRQAIPEPARSTVTSVD